MTPYRSQALAGVDRHERRAPGPLPPRRHRPPRDHLRPRGAAVDARRAAPRRAGGPGLPPRLRLAPRNGAIRRRRRHRGSYRRRVALEPFTPTVTRLVRPRLRGADAGPGAGLAGDRDRRARADLARRPARARRSPRSCGASTASSPTRAGGRPHARSSTSRRSRRSPTTSSATCARRCAGSARDVTRRRSAPATRRSASARRCAARRRTS